MKRLKQINLRIGYISIRGCFVLLLLCMSLGSHAQVLSPVEIYARKHCDPKLLEGQWMLESVSSIKGEETINLNDSGFEFFEEMEFNKESVRIKSNKQSLTGKFNTSGNSGMIEFDFPSVPFSSGWAVIDGKLYIQQRIDFPEERTAEHAHHHHNGIQCSCIDPSVMYISYVFKKRN